MHLLYTIALLPRRLSRRRLHTLSHSVHAGSHRCRSRVLESQSSSIVIPARPRSHLDDRQCTPENGRYLAIFGLNVQYSTVNHLGLVFIRPKHSDSVASLLFSHFHTIQNVDMRSPVVAFSLFAAAAVSVSAGGLPKSHELNALSPPASLNKDSGGARALTNEPRADSVGLGIAGIARDSAGAISHNERLHGDGRVDGAGRDDGRPQRDERPQKPGVPYGDGNSGNGCTVGNPTADATEVENGALTAIDDSGTNGGVSCSGDVHAGNADGSPGSGNAASPDAGPASGSDVYNKGVADLLGTQGQSGGTSESASASGGDPASMNEAEQGPVFVNGYPTYASGGATPARRSITTLSAEQARTSLFDVVNATTGQAQAPSSDSIVRRFVKVRREPTELFPYDPSTVVYGDDDAGDGTSGDCVRGAEIPGQGTRDHPGGTATSGTVGPCDNGSVIEHGNVVDGDGASNTPGAGGRSESGTAVGGDGY
ncbi:hypothetical protein WOLCODRAFT_147575 [Wolfiporia cocos MD-104 SS10]|uniref:Uncharacterized protein n=1 Tax=Wolfiporia cocos (strain MD-104) TaxID=742152 RepID=A0A2H3IU24_WOLCO|nr:hypothetical protein WOLCODRAFT_147575 [Wolfiporia cocos MD-104 SS10]